MHAGKADEVERILDEAQELRNGLTDKYHALCAAIDVDPCREGRSLLPVIFDGADFGDALERLMHLTYPKRDQQ